MFTDDFAGWKRIVFPIRNPDSTIGTPDWTQVSKIRFSSSDKVSAQTWYLDRGGLDVGRWVKVEVQVPDELKQGDYYA